jgi:hypothetical protein
VLPVASPNTNGSLVLYALARMASLITSATFLDAYALVVKNLGYIFYINENLGKLAK